MIACHALSPRDMSSFPSWKVRSSLHLWWLGGRGRVFQKMGAMAHQVFFLDSTGQNSLTDRVPNIPSLPDWVGWVDLMGSCRTIRVIPWIGPRSNLAPNANSHNKGIKLLCKYQYWNGFTHIIVQILSVLEQFVSSGYFLCEKLHISLISISGGGGIPVHTFSPRFLIYWHVVRKTNILGCRE